MRHALIVTGGILITILLHGCAILGSTGGDKAKLPAGGGLVYSLPKGLLNVKLSDRSGDLMLAVSGPIYVPDVPFTYLLQYKPSPFSSDTVELKVDPDTNLLQSVNATADDQSGQILVELARAAAMLAQAGEAPAGVEEYVILDRKFDPADDLARGTLEAEMNAVAQAHAATMFKKNCNGGQAGNKNIGCDSYARLQKGANILFKVTPPKQAMNVEPAECSTGACYRAVVPYEIGFSFNGLYSYSTFVNLPNGQPAIVLPLARAPFVKREGKVEFQNGILKLVHFVKPSEALAIASLPVEIMTAIFKSISDLIQLKIDLTDKETAMTNSKKAEVVALKELYDKQKELPQSAKAQLTPVLLSGSSGGKHIMGKIEAIPSPQSSSEPQKLDGSLTSPSNSGILAPSGKGSK